MKITYLELPDKDKLISYHQHDYKVKYVDGRMFSIDSGQNEEFVRICNPENKATFKREELSDLIEFIRNDITFDSIMLKHRTNEEIDAFLNFRENIKNKKLEKEFYYQVYKEELNYRKQNGIK